jgi:hypothetical protein
MDIKAKVILSVIVAIFVIHSLSLNFTQDDPSSPTGMSRIS